MKDRFLDQLALEIKREEQQLAGSLRQLETAPPGSLTIRKRSKGETYFLNEYEDNGGCQKRRQKCITEDEKLVLQLTEKAVQKKIAKKVKSNLKLLYRLYDGFEDASLEAVLEELGPQYQKVLRDRRQSVMDARLKKAYRKAPFQPGSHIHETDYGELVRSKSEQILANTLLAYGIPFHYEEEFMYRIGIEGINRVYPDFTILLPGGRRILWEHLGLLSDPEYCWKTAQKLNLYQKNGFVIGDSLILTMDDNKGNFSSAVIRQNIELLVLPRLGEVRVSKEQIAAGMQR